MSANPAQSTRECDHSDVAYREHEIAYCVTCGRDLPDRSSANDVTSSQSTCESEAR